MKRFLLAAVTLLSPLDSALAQSVTDAELLSQATDGTPGDDDSENVAISPNSRKFIFASSANNLVAGDTGSQSDLFSVEETDGVRTVKLFVTGPNGTFPNGESSEPRVTPVLPDGKRFAVAFLSHATDLISGFVPKNDTKQLFVSFQPKGELILVSRALGSTEPGSKDLKSSDGSAFSPSIAIRSVEPGELRVAFLSDAPDLGPKAPNPNRVRLPFLAIVKKRDGKPGWDVSIESVPTPDDTKHHDSIVLSGDGLTTAYTVDRPNSSPAGGPSFLKQVYRAKQGETPELVSQYALTNGREAKEPTISFNGQVVAFLLGEPASQSSLDGLFYVRTGDDFSGRPTQANTNSQGVASDGEIVTQSGGTLPRAQLSANGVFVAFSDTGGNLTESNSGPYADAQTYVKNLLTGEIVRTSALASAGVTRGQNGSSYAVDLGGAFFNSNSITATFISKAINLSSSNSAQAYRATVTFTPPPLTQGAPIDAPPDVRVTGDRATIRLQQFSSAAGTGGGPASIQANRVRYSTTIRENSTRKRIQLVTARNRVTVRKLSPGRYTVRYRVSSPGPGGGTVTSKYSPKQPMTIN